MWLQRDPLANTRPITIVLVMLGGHGIEVTETAHSGPECNKVLQNGIWQTFNFHIFASLQTITPWSIMYMQSFL